jgi:hypothetical protein
MIDFIILKLCAKVSGKDDVTILYYHDRGIICISAFSLFSK